MAVKNKRKIRMHAELLFSLAAIILIGVVYYVILRSSYYDSVQDKYTDSSFDINFISLLKEVARTSMNGKTVTLLSLTGYTLLHFLLSFALAILFGIGIGVIIGINKTLGTVSEYFINFFRVLPSIIFIVIFKYQFRFFDNYVYMVGAIACIWPIIINTKSGVEKVNKTLREAMNILHIPGWQKLRLYILPEAWPNIWDGMKTSLGIAFLIAITCEYLDQSLYGLGSILSYYDNPGYVRHGMIIIIWIGFLGVLTNFIYSIVERKSTWLTNQFSTEDE